MNSNQKKKKKHRATPTHNTSTHNISESNDKIKDIKNSQRGNSYHTNNYFCERHQSTQLTVILRARRQWINALIILVENYFKTWGLFSAKLSIKHDRYSFGQYLRKTVWTTNQEKLPEKYCDHPLFGNYKDFRECHIQPDWLLIYSIDDKDLELYLFRTGTHSDLYWM